MIINSKQNLLAYMLHGATIITPNNRLSNQLLEDYYYNQAQLVGKKPFCLPYSTFLRDLFYKIRYQYPNIQHPVLLNAAQLRTIWQDIISNHNEYLCNEGLFNAIHAASTYCQLHEILPTHERFSDTPQTCQFQQWQQKLFAQLIQKNAIIDTQLVQYIQQFPQILQINTIVWVCFDEYTPQQRTLQQAFTDQGCAQYHYDLKHNTTPAQQYAACDTQDERLQLMQWLKTRMTAGDKRIAVVIPELETCRFSLERFFKRYFILSEFSFSQSQPLFDVPLIAHAFTWLSLSKKTIKNQDACLLLQSPFLSGAQLELMTRSKLLQSAICLQEATIVFEQWIEEISATAPILANLLTTANDYPEYDCPKAWVYHFKHRLQLFGFPGDDRLDLVNYQSIQTLMSLFDEFLSLSLVKPIMTQTQALNALKDLISNSSLPAPKSTAPIQIMNLQEALGLEFDSLWVSGLTDVCLPKKANYSAFIPLKIQQKPAADQLTLAKQQLQRLQNASQHTIMSYPRLTQDTPNMPCPLITTLPKWQAFAPMPQSTNTTIGLIPFEDVYSHPLQQSETALGGTALLANQAKCPFRAFAAHRLHLTPELTISTGLSASVRGQVLHHIMEQLWHDLKSLQNLNNMEARELENRIQIAIDNALTPIISNRFLSFPTLVQSVEKNCLTRLVKACFTWEKQRSDFTVTAVEQTFVLELAGLTFRVRVDRLDTLSSGEKWVIDYKTSLPSNKPWHEERPEAPQLLLYALLDESIKALLFVQLKAGRVSCVGLSEEATATEGLSALKKNEHWSDYQTKWHRQLTTLATEFQTGFCPPIPTRASTCASCDFQNLCRI